ncbi:TRAPP subunit TRS20 [Aspergillus luchuensis]|uniref:Trafficking protein particle complex subunit 2/Sedlin n=8 Tax=Aspergillus subgen. Circumdati TaxID=2720871 RepID=A0A1L9MU99_ASPTC|nr:trafficking protein particle complex subunit 2/Sedlin [Aspergillus eucalypticola CBS 122712]XP_025509830.1 trafficking protein particle complex subunit 2/Sedlin [Aspergillus piperis CBS 112811]XP_025535908.1 trafficking protein particle complex subunit 2/Sedlin [Aspergillus costaricaensis CBS 115574]XP_025565092.1 trafficking protein particle complex subunit 2/Sedlin [Aspergillus vadensis CBS 113365]XP_035352777.1 trafficking protein particle complex subunit 2/Sedlin [Aspergillus tubingensis
MSYYFTILSPTDVPLFNIAFGTSKSGGDGIARFRFPDTAQYMNQFIIHSSLDIVEEAQWMNGNMYLKHIDTYPPASAYISAFLTPSGARFLLLHQPPQLASNSGQGAGGSGSMGGSMSGSLLLGSAGGSSRASASSIANNPTSPQTEEAVRQFMTEVYENYVKTVMSPFYRQGMEIKSPVFRGRVTAAGRKWL